MSMFLNKKSIYLSLILLGLSLSNTGCTLPLNKDDNSSNFVVALKEPTRTAYTSEADLSLCVSNKVHRVEIRWSVNGEVVKQGEVNELEPLLYLIPHGDLKEGTYQLEAEILKDNDETIYWSAPEPILIDNTLSEEDLIIDPMSASWSNDQKVTISMNDRGEFQSGIKTILVYVDEGDGTEVNNLDTLHFPDKENPTVRKNCEGKKLCSYEINLQSMVSDPLLETKPFTLQSGFHYLKIISEDAAGNSVEKITGPYQIDLDRPHVLDFKINKNPL